MPAGGGDSRGSPTVCLPAGRDLQRRGLLFQLRLGSVIGQLYMHLNDTTAICHCHLELVTINVDRFAAGRQMAEGLHHQPANGIHFFIAEVRVEGVVEVFKLLIAD